jgi:hypothetical protein
MVIVPSVNEYLYACSSSFPAIHFCTLIYLRTNLVVFVHLDDSCNLYWTAFFPLVDNPYIFLDCVFPLINSKVMP